MPVVEASLTRPPIINTNVSGNKTETIIHVSSAVRFLFLDLTWPIVLTHVCMLVFPNIECIFSAKSFSFENLLSLTKFQTLSTVCSNAVYIVHFYETMLCLF